MPFHTLIVVAMDRHILDMDSLYVVHFLFNVVYLLVYIGTLHLHMEYVLYGIYRWQIDCDSQYKGAFCVAG